MNTNRPTAQPARWSVQLTATCEVCGQEITRTLPTKDGDFNLHELVDQFPWYHAATGAEVCEPEPDTTPEPVDPMDDIPWGTPDSWIPDNPNEDGFCRSDFI